VIEFDAPSVERVVCRLTEDNGVHVTDAHLRLSGYCAKCRDRAGGWTPDEA
jgi:Fe2+ or Zn2+ uptake regulation protein